MPEGEQWIFRVPLSKNGVNLAKETLIKSCHAIWRPFSRLVALSDGSISPVSPTVTRLARRENDSPSDVTAFDRCFPKEVQEAFMKVSTKGQYALRVMLDFAAHAGKGYIRLRDVADRQGISKAYLEQIMVLLNKSDFFVTARGYQGGYQLARPASAYTIGMILRVTEGSLAPVDTDETPAQGSDLRVSAMTDDVWRGLTKVVTEYLDSLTLQQLLDCHPASEGFDFVI
jgi:Rrf2 family protein